LSAQAQLKARALATETLIAYRNAGCPAPQAPSAPWLDRIVRFMIKSGHEDFMNLLRHELNLPKDAGAPSWSVNDFPAVAKLRVAVVGSGFAGIAAAHRLKQTGLNFTVIATGGLSSILTNLGGVFDAVDRNLTLDGLRLITEANS
jgi:hypothetical protein